MPSTSSSSSTDVKPPLLSRHARIACGRHRADAGQGVEGRLVGGVEVDQRVTAGRRGRRPVPATPAAGATAHDDLLAVDDGAGEVERGEVDAPPRAARRLQGVHHPGPGGQHHDPGTSYLAGDVDHQLLPGTGGAGAAALDVRRHDRRERRRRPGVGRSRGDGDRAGLVTHRPPCREPDGEGRDHGDDGEVHRPELQPADPQPTRCVAARHRRHDGRGGGGGGGGGDQARTLADPGVPVGRVVRVVRLAAHGRELRAQRRQPPRHRLGVLGGRLGSAHASTLGIATGPATGAIGNLWRGDHGSTRADLWTLDGRHGR